MGFGKNGGSKYSPNNQSWVATEGQTVFTLNNGSYKTGTKTIEVYVGGVKQVSGQHFTETSPTSFTLSEGVPVGMLIEAEWIQGAIPMNMAHNSTHKKGGSDEINIIDIAGYKENVEDKMGLLSGLKTTAKSNLKDAINENYDRLGNLSNFGVNAESYPVITPEVDDTARFNRALTALNTVGGGELKLATNKTYTVNTNQLTLYSNIIIKSVGKATLVKTNATSGSIFSSSNLSNIGFEKVWFNAPNSTVIAISLKTSSNVTVEKCGTINAQLFLSDSTATSYANVTNDSQLSSNIILDKNICTGDRSAQSAYGGTVAIGINYSKDVSITNNKISGYGHGIMWWGGDANPSVNGSLANTRWAKNIEIANNTIDNTTGGGGIWGSMGAFITITGNTVLNCGDVGIDLEGCFFSTVTGNTVQNCVNGGITTFFLCKGIEIAGNTISSNVSGQLLIKIYNSTQSTDNKNIAIIGNTLIGDGVICTVQSDAVDKVIFTGNECTNVKINFNANNIHFVDVKDNQMIFDVASTTSFNAIDAGQTNANGRAIIKGNTIHSSVTQPAGSIGISATQNDYNTSPITTINGNEIFGFPIDIQTAGNSVNPGINPVFIIKNNTLGSANYIRNDSANSKVQLINNNDGNGLTYPSAVPISGKWDKDQRIYTSATAGGAIGSVCITGGFANNTAWVASTAYSVGQQVNTGGNVYECITAGTSGTTAPTGTGVDIVDGNAHWKYVSVLAVFKPFGLISE